MHGPVDGDDQVQDDANSIVNGSHDDLVREDGGTR
jgi:hypothetical protein